MLKNTIAMLTYDARTVLFLLIPVVVVFGFGAMLGAVAMQHNKHYQGDVIEQYLSGQIVCSKYQQEIICDDNEAKEPVSVKDLVVEGGK